MTFSDQPRGRRARPENGSSDWPGYDNAPREDRELPDLSPIRPNEARSRDGQVRGRGRHSAGGAGGVTGQAPWDTQGQQQYAPDQQYGQAQQYGQPQQHAPVAPGSAPLGSAPLGSAPPAPVTAAGTQQAAQRPPGQSSDWDEDDPDANDPMAAFSERWRRRGEETPKSARKRKSRLYMIGGGVVAVIIAVSVYFFVGDSGGAANTGLQNLITTFLPGELQQVPNACTSVPSATLSKYLPGQLKMAEPPLNSGAQSECTWTLDNAPTYRVLEVNLTAYAPDALVGNGSATFAATFAMSEDETAKQHPGSKSGQPKAVVADINDLGSSAFSSYQVFNQGSTVTDMATVYVRYRNVVVQVVENGLDKGTSTSGKAYGPVSQSELQQGALTVAKQVTAAING